MKVQGRHTFDVSLDILWNALLNPDVIAKTLPGCDRLEKMGENEYQGVFNIQIGPVQGQFEGKFALSNIRSPESYHLKVSGSGTTGFMEGEGDIRLEAQHGSTILHYDVDVQVGGRVASVGQRLLESSARVITRQSLEQLNRQVKTLGRSEGAGSISGRTQSPEGPSQAQFAAGVARGVLSDLIARNRRLTVWVAGLSTLLVLFLLFSRACSG